MDNALPGNIERCEVAPQPSDVKVGYFKRAFRGDLTAGLTVAIVAVPQSMAYAIIAGVHPAYGLYTTIVACVIGAAFGSSNHLITGPTNATCLMLAGAVSAYTGILSPLETILLLTFVTGVIKFFCGAFHLGRLVSFIPDAVIVGFATGAGVLIIGGQIRHVLGVEANPAHGFFMQMIDMLSHAKRANMYAVALGSGTAILMLISKRLNPRVPSAIISVILTGGLVYALRLEEKGVATVGTIGEIARSLPQLRLFPMHVESSLQLAGAAGAIAIVGLMEATAISKAIARMSGQRININREFMAQGLANMGTAFFSGFASSGSFTRSAVNFRNGARTRWAAIYSSVFVLMAVLIFGPVAEHIPIASLAGILIVVASQMVSREHLRLAFRGSRESAIVLIATIAATMTLPLHYALYVGVGTSLLLLLRRTSTLHITRLIPKADGRFIELEFDNGHAPSVTDEIVVLNVSGEMYFAAVSDFEERVHALMTQRPRAIILRLRRVTYIGSTALAALEHISDRLRGDNIPLVLCGLSNEQTNVLRITGLLEKIGDRNIFPASDEILYGLCRAVERAEAMSGV